MKIDFESEDADQVREFLKWCYADNIFKLEPSKSAVQIKGNRIGNFAVYDVLYPSTFSFLSETNRSQYLFLTCVAGRGYFKRGIGPIEAKPGLTVPISAHGVSNVVSDGMLAHVSVHVDADYLQDLCERWTGEALIAPLVFEHKPFSEVLSLYWLQATQLLQGMLKSKVSPLASARLEEMLVGLVLEHHPHTYSDFFGRSPPALPPTIKEAVAFMTHEARTPVTIASICSAVGTSVLSLRAGFLRTPWMHAPILSRPHSNS